MRKLSVVILMALAFGSLSLNAAASDKDPKNDNGDEIRVTAVSDQFMQIDARPKGLSVGDYLAFSDELHKHKKGDSVGHLDGVCHVTNVDGHDYRALCIVTATLDDGTITHQGVVESTEAEATFAVTGGTGDYRGASGETDVRFVSDTRAKIEVDLD
jgi:hypothetical protein